MTRLRTTRAYDGQATMMMASTALRSPGPSAATTAIARMIGGKAKTRSLMRMIVPSSRPAK